MAKEIKAAIISEDKLYRYWLTRIWDGKKPKVMFIMLNPSTADASQDDPTIRRCIDYAKQWGYGGLEVVNLFAFRCSDPMILHARGRSGTDIIGPENDDYILKASMGCKMVICAWGNNADDHRERVEEVMDFFNTLHCLELSKLGQPKHPLYLTKTKVPLIFKQKGNHN